MKPVEKQTLNAYFTQHHFTIEDAQPQETQITSRGSQHQENQTPNSELTKWRLAFESNKIYALFHLGFI